MKKWQNDKIIEYMDLKCQHIIFKLETYFQIIRLSEILDNREKQFTKEEIKTLDEDKKVQPNLC